MHTGPARDFNFLTCAATYNKQYVIAQACDYNSAATEHVTLTADRYVGAGAGITPYQLRTYQRLYPEKEFELSRAVAFIHDRI